MTKLSLLTAALAAAATLAAPAGASTATDLAGDRFAFATEQTSLGAVRLGNIVADAGSVVEVYDYRAGRVGRLLGSEALREGTNIDVRVPLGVQRRNDVLAVLKVAGAVAGQQIIRANRRF